MTRRAVISGAAGGIGRALAEGFLEAGYSVVGIDRAEQGWFAPNFDYRMLDLRDTDAVAQFGLGLDELDVLVNAAGTIRRGDEYKADVFADVVDINLTGSMRLATACRRALANGGGAIINVASIWAFFGGPLVPAYTASKSAVVGLTKSLAVAWAAEGVRVNAIAPGWIATPMTRAVQDDPSRSRAILDRTPMGRWGTPADLVGPALFLAGESSGFVTGVVLPVDGGYSSM